MKAIHRVRGERRRTRTRVLQQRRHLHAGRSANRADVLRVRTVAIDHVAPESDIVQLRREFADPAGLVAAERYERPVPEWRCGAAIQFIALGSELGASGETVAEIECNPWMCVVLNSVAAPGARRPPRRKTVNANVHSFGLKAGRRPRSLRKLAAGDLHPRGARGRGVQRQDQNRAPQDQDRTANGLSPPEELRLV